MQLANQVGSVSLPYCLLTSLPKVWFAAHARRYCKRSNTCKWSLDFSRFLHYLINLCNQKLLHSTIEHSYMMRIVRHHHTADKKGLDLTSTQPSMSDVVNQDAQAFLVMLQPNLVFRSCYNQTWLEDFGLFIANDHCATKHFVPSNGFDRIQYFTAVFRL